MKKQAAFTLIEVLLALLIIAIAFTALMKASSENIRYTERLKTKTLAHLVAMQGVTMIQLGLITLQSQQPTTEASKQFNQTWYWRVRAVPTALPRIQRIYVTVSQTPAGPFGNEIQAYWYSP